MYQMKEKEQIFVYTGPDGSGRKRFQNGGNDVRYGNGYLIHDPSTPALRKGWRRLPFCQRRRIYENERQREFLEHVEIEGFHYGIREEDVVKAFENHNLIYLTLNPEGAEKLKKMYGDKVMRFFIYADRDTVIERQRARQDDEEAIARHMRQYEATMKYRDQCEYAFENFDAPQVSFQVSEVIEAFLERNLIITD